MIAVSLTPFQQSTIEQLWCRLKDTPMQVTESAVVAATVGLLCIRGLTPVQCVDVVLYERAHPEFAGCERQLLDVVIDSLKQRGWSEQDIAEFVGTLAQGFAIVTTAGRQFNATAGAQ